MAKNNYIADGVCRADGVVLADGAWQLSAGSYLVESEDKLEDIVDAKPGAWASTAGNRQRWQLDTDGVTWQPVAETAVDQAVSSAAESAASAAESAAVATTVKNSIPESYSDLSDDIVGIKNQMDALFAVQTADTSTINVSGKYLFDPKPATKVIASTNCTFTGRNLMPIYTALGNKYPTVDNDRAYRQMWGTETSEMVTMLNQLPAGKYTLTVAVLLNEVNASYDGTSEQKVGLTVYVDETQIEGASNITESSTGDVEEASVTFTLTEDTAGQISHAYLYVGNATGGTALKWQYRLAYAQIESGVKTSYKEYTEITGTETVAFDLKMSATATGNYTITYVESDGLTADEELPEYFQNEVEDCVSKLENYCTDKALVYMIVTDTHVHTDSATRNRWKATIKNLKAVHKSYQADGLIHLGDMINGTIPSSASKEIIRMIRDDLRSVMEPNFILVGNHDTNTHYGTNMDDPITEAEMYALWERYNEKDITSRPGALPYWYKDYDSLGIRVICLSSSMGDGTHGAHGDNWGFPTAEITWLQNEALDTDYQVLLFSHMPMTQGYISNAGELPYNGPDMINAIAAFQSGGGVVIGLINGHTHFDYVNNNGHFKEISLGCTKLTNNTADTYGTSIFQFAPAEAVCYGRTSGTVTQDLWNILVVKPTERECKLIRFGAGEDVTWTY